MKNYNLNLLCEYNEVISINNIYLWWGFDLKNKHFWIKMLVLIIPFVSLGLVCTFRADIIRLGSRLPACPSYTYFHVYCPGCGNTRSVQHLLQGDIIGSLKFNPTPIFGIIIGILAYFEVILFVFNMYRRVIPRSRAFWSVVIIFFLLYFLIRNFVNIY